MRIVKETGRKMTALQKGREAAAKGKGNWPAIRKASEMGIDDRVIAKKFLKFMEEKKALKNIRKFRWSYRLDRSSVQP